MKNPFDAIAPGKKGWIEFPVGHLPSGTPIAIRAKVFKAPNPGPVMLVLGGVHGDEVNGIEIVRRVIDAGFAKRLSRGTLVAIPILNMFGFLNFSRDVPDGKDVNRSFPGSKNGSLASRVAYAFTRYILPHIDFGIDCHTGGNSIYNFPQLRCDSAHMPSRVLAEAFAPPVILHTPTLPKSLRRTAQLHNKPIVVFEGGENMRVNKEAVREAILGVKRVLIHHQMLSDDRMHTPERTLVLNHHTWLRAKRSGLFEWRIQSGRWVEEGEVMGWIRDPNGDKHSELICPRRGFIIGQDNSPVVHLGDALFHLAW